MCDKCMDLRASTSAEKWLDLSLHLAIAQSERAFMREWSTLGATMGFPAISFDMAGTTRVPSFVEETKVCAKHDRRTHSHNDAMLSSLSFLSSSPRAHPFLLPLPLFPVHALCILDCTGVVHGIALVPGLLLRVWAQV